MTYQIINSLDEHLRLVRLPKYSITNKPEQLNSHTVSYLYARDLYKEMGDVMGLER